MIMLPPVRIDSENPSGGNMLLGVWMTQRVSCEGGKRVLVSVSCMSRWAFSVVCYRRMAFPGDIGRKFSFNIFNFPLHSQVLKYRLYRLSCEKSVSEFQLEYLEFKFRYGDFDGKIRLKSL